VYYTPGTFNISFPVKFYFLVIRISVRNLSLKLFADSAFTAVSGKLFQRIVALLEKEILPGSYLTWPCLTLYVR